MLYVEIKFSFHTQDSLNEKDFYRNTVGKEFPYCLTEKIFCAAVQQKRFTFYIFNINL